MVKKESVVRMCSKEVYVRELYTGTHTHAHTRVPSVCVCVFVRTHTHANVYAPSLCSKKKGVVRMCRKEECVVCMHMQTYMLLLACSREMQCEGGINTHSIALVLVHALV